MVHKSCPHHERNDNKLKDYLCKTLLKVQFNELYIPAVARVLNTLVNASRPDGSFQSPVSSDIFIPRSLVEEGITVSISGGKIGPPLD
jgi:hypothetical protein